MHFIISHFIHFKYISILSSHLLVGHVQQHEDENIKKLQFHHAFLWVWNLVCHPIRGYCVRLGLQLIQTGAREHLKVFNPLFSSPSKQVATPDILDFNIMQCLLIWVTSYKSEIWFLASLNHNYAARLVEFQKQVVWIEPSFQTSSQIRMHTEYATFFETQKTRWSNSHEATSCIMEEMYCFWQRKRLASEISDWMKASLNSFSCAKLHANLYQ
jgi:hypothetical protein